MKQIVILLILGLVIFFAVTTLQKYLITKKELEIERIRAEAIAQQAYYQAQVSLAEQQADSSGFLGSALSGLPLIGGLF